MHYELMLPNGKTEALLDIPHYDSNWQTAYHLLEPRTLPAGSQIRCKATFDNSASNLNNPDPSKEVRWGPAGERRDDGGLFRHRVSQARSAGAPRQAIRVTTSGQLAAGSMTPSIGRRPSSMRINRILCVTASSSKILPVDWRVGKRRGHRLRSQRRAAVHLGYRHKPPIATHRLGMRDGRCPFAP